MEIQTITRTCYAHDRQKNRSRIIFVKISIPETEREIALRDLGRMNINAATLFPDLKGAAEYCNMKLDIQRYA